MNKEHLIYGGELPGQLPLFDVAGCAPGEFDEDEQCDGCPECENDDSTQK